MPPVWHARFELDPKGRSLCGHFVAVAPLVYVKYTATIDV
jgi:hypothetical protein